MSALRSPAHALAALTVAASVAGCISLLPKEKPAQLYRFGFSAAPAQPRSGGTFSVSQAPTSFERAAASDMILTVTGDEAAYIGGSRWVTSASSLFDAAVARAFDAAGGPARLIPHGEPAHAEFALKLDVRQFETRYDHGQQAPPTIVIELYAGMVDRSPDAAGRVVERIFQASAPAAENRTWAIARAYDVALAKVLTDMVTWVGNKGA